ncbi:MAG: ribonuclease Z, partial [Treponema sp.]|nr:ribonuclease Z [Treponema sp.]
FVTDTLAFPEIAGEVKGSDLFVCEGMFERELAATAREKKHMTAEQAARIALAAQVKKLALIHYSPRYTEYNLKQLLKEAQAVFPETILSRDRAVYPIEYED